MKLHQNPSTSSCALCCSLFLQHVILLYSMSLFQPTATIDSVPLGNETDMFALLKFRESISNDPVGVLSSWNDSFHFCQWRGIECSGRHDQRITGLNLEGLNLVGTILPYIGNLSFLRFINLKKNNFFGEIPQQVGRLFRLQHLNLTENMLEGKIPVNLSFCSELRILSLGKNKLSGMIPSEFSSLVKLVHLNLESNNLTGEIPPSLGNISSLGQFSLAYNNLVGSVPDELGRLKSLTLFSIGPNSLSGTIPLSLYNISSMVDFSIASNNFHGTLPPNIGHLLPSLQSFFIGGNEFSGIIPQSFSNASHLQILDIPENNFFGQVPTSLGNLLNLRWLGLSNNSLGNYSTDSLHFISSLTNCSQLNILDLSMNNLGVVLPNSVANLSIQLTKLYFGGNQISGNIPTSLENLINLTILAIDSNLFTGVIPASLGKLQNLQVLALDRNSLSGKIPSSIGNLTQMSELYLFDNKLEDVIPPEIADCQSLQYIDISNNSLSGAIPEEVFGLSSTISLILSRNSLNGSLPIEVGKLKQMNELDLSENNLTSEIPEAIGECESLEFLYLEGNFFQGILPSSLASLRSLRYLDLSRNNLTGKIPKAFEELPLLLYINVSFNDLEGEVPNKGVFQNTSAISMVGNTKLCGGVIKLKLPACPIEEFKQGKVITHKLRIIIIVCVATIFLLFSGFVILYWRRKTHRKSTAALSEISFLSKVSYKMLYRATNGFSTSMLIGIGSFGSVYKGILDKKENIVAIKVLNLNQKGAAKSFIAECNALRNIRHRNLVRILTCCSSMDYNGNEFKALVFEYMLNGSLEKWLHLVEGENRPTSLNLIQRLNIAIDVASAIFYLHEECNQPIIHCDLKPSNVLLDNEMIAHVSDFGLARLVSNTVGLVDGITSTTGIKGTIGYAAPEYAMGGEPSRQGDVYSYGILILEMFTGRRPTDEMFKDDFNLHNFVKMALPERFAQIVDSAILPGEEEEEASTREEEKSYEYNYGGIEIDEEEGNMNVKKPYQISINMHECLVSVLEIGIACSEESPNKRMNMEDVTRELQRIRNAYIDNGIHENI